MIHERSSTRMPASGVPPSDGDVSRAEVRPSDGERRACRPPSPAGATAGSARRGAAGARRPAAYGVREKRTGAPASSNVAAPPAASTSTKKSRSRRNGSATRSAASCTGRPLRPYACTISVSAARVNPAAKAVNAASGRGSAMNAACDIDARIAGSSPAQPCASSIASVRSGSRHAEIAT